MGTDHSGTENQESVGGDLGAIVSRAMNPFTEIFGQLNSLAEQGINYMLCLVGTALLLYLTIAGVAGESSLSSAEFIALAAAGTVITVAGAGFRAIGARSSLRESTKVTESALELANKSLDQHESRQADHKDLVS